MFIISCLVPDPNTVSFPLKAFWCLLIGPWRNKCHADTMWSSIWASATESVHIKNIFKTNLIIEFTHKRTDGQTDRYVCNVSCWGFLRSYMCVSVLCYSVCVNVLICGCVSGVRCTEWFHQPEIAAELYKSLTHAPADRRPDRAGDRQTSPPSNSRKKNREKSEENYKSSSKKYCKTVKDL